jgi:MoaA/NifB/PqqE/SkfB family radical SAM enzyme
MTTAENAHEASMVNGLSFLWLEITGRCNLFCSHCYADSGPRADLHGNMTYGNWTRVIDEAAELGCRSVQFIGGEPTMHPQLDDLVDHANHRGFEFIEVFTNATRLGKELVGCFQRCGVHVATSFYSDDPGVHDHITQGRGSWQRTVSGIETALAAGLPIRVGVIETERNVGHGPHAIEFLKALGVQDLRMDRERGVGRGKLVHLGGEGERYQELCGQCWKGKLCVTSNADIFPCVFARATPLGDVRSGLSPALRTAKLATFRRKVRAMHQRGASEIVMCAPESCAPESCAPESCAPKSCAPESCAPKSCAPEDCDP